VLQQKRYTIITTYTLMLKMEWEEVKLIKPHPSLLKNLHKQKKAASFINNLKEKIIIKKRIIIIPHLERIEQN